MTEPLVEMRAIAKTYGAVRALHRVDLTLAPGEVLGLVGDNAAGKSTLMKVLAGAVPPDAGEIHIAGVPATFDGPIAARAAGIEMVHQDFALVPQLTVTQNVFLGREMLRAPARVCRSSNGRRWTRGRASCSPRWVCACRRLPCRCGRSRAASSRRWRSRARRASRRNS